MNLATVSNWTSTHAVSQAIGLVTLTAVEIASPVRRLVGFKFNRFVVGHLEVVKVLKLVALFGLQQSKNLVDATRGTSVRTAALTAFISCVLNRVVQLAILASEEPTLIHAVRKFRNKIKFRRVSALASFELETSGNVIDLKGLGDVTSAGDPLHLN